MIQLRAEHHDPGVSRIANGSGDPPSEVASCLYNGRGGQRYTYTPEDAPCDTQRYDSIGPDSADANLGGTREARRGDEEFSAWPASRPYSSLLPQGVALLLERSVSKPRAHSSDQARHTSSRFFRRRRASQKQTVTLPTPEHLLSRPRRQLPRTASLNRAPKPSSSPKPDLMGLSCNCLPLEDSRAGCARCSLQAHRAHRANRGSPHTCRRLDVCQRSYSDHHILQ